MTDDIPIRYVPVTGSYNPLPSRRLELSELKVTATVAVGDIDQRPTANVLPHVSMSVTQYVRLSDDSLVRLDMDRGTTSVRHGAAEGEVISWKRPLDDVITDVLNLVRPDDDEDAAAHPWDELAAAARRRGVDVDAAALSALPYHVLLSADAVAVFVQ